MSKQSPKSKVSRFRLTIKSKGPPKEEELQEKRQRRLSDDNNQKRQNPRTREGKEEFLEPKRLFDENSQDMTQRRDKEDSKRDDERCLPLTKKEMEIVDQYAKYGEHPSPTVHQTMRNIDTTLGAFIPNFHFSEIIFVFLCFT